MTNLIIKHANTLLKDIMIITGKNHLGGKRGVEQLAKLFHLYVNSLSDNSSEFKISVGGLDVAYG